jgi:type VI secretion system protein ImpJ
VRAVPKRPKPYWFEGPDLDPAFWQYQDEYHEELLEERLSTVTPYAWGVLAADLDEGALRSGVVRFARFEAVLRDGTIVHAAPDADVLPERALDESLARAESVDVYVALPHLDPALPNMDRIAENNEPRSREEGPAGARLRLVAASTDLASPRVPRYTTRIDRVADMAGDYATHMPMLRSNLRLVFGTEPRDRMEAVKVAELVRTGAGVLALREAFVPPALRIGASRFLLAGFRQVLGAMVAKQQALATSRRQRSASMVEFQAADAARFWLLHTLNSHLLAIADVAGKPDTHPARAHDKLAALIGALCTFDAAADPMQVPLYDHLLPGPIFERMFGMALGLLDRLIAERHVQIPLQTHEGDIFSGLVNDPKIFHHAFFFAVSAAQGVNQFTVRQLWEHVPNYAKVAAGERLMTLMNSHTHGAPLEPVHSPPAALPVKSDVAFFRVNTQNQYWTEIIQYGSIAIHLPVPGVSLALYAVDPQTLQ